MNRRIRNQSAATKPENSYLRFLKPGALAQLRDSKINARTHLRSSDSQIYLHRAIPSSPTSPSRSLNTAGIIQQQQQDVTGNLTTADGELPFLSARFYAPRCLQRKKLMAVRSMCYLNHNSSSLTSDGPVPAIDVL
ncbi:hypothetical protein L1987_26835 [Smallanthus sonchifolius]|uniref:Uncharacterized protein n=1 Tax=Smallanthus sonchifolius TaxID=185202 RepID=A0ACB9I9N4_9ASTR|nr:hypothetical protein L1987_26835 [Smallanthus sonchifolius]